MPRSPTSSRLSATNAYVAQHNSYFSRTFDGGATAWFRDYIGSIAVNAIDAFDANKVVVVGDAGKVYYSTNAAGATPTWSAKTTGTTNNLNGVQMLDADSWIVVGDNETILRTDNAGATWTGSRALGESRPSTITSPAPGFAVGSTTISISGTASDAGVGVERVQVSLQRGAGEFWDGSNWTATETWHDATTTDGWKTWSATPPSIDTAAGWARRHGRARVTDWGNTARASRWRQAATRRPQPPSLLPRHPYQALAMAPRRRSRAR